MSPTASICRRELERSEAHRTLGNNATVVSRQSIYKHPGHPWMPREQLPCAQPRQTKKSHIWAANFSKFIFLPSPKMNSPKWAGRNKVKCSPAPDLKHKNKRNMPTVQIINRPILLLSQILIFPLSFGLKYSHLGRERLVVLAKSLSKSLYSH